MTTSLLLQEPDTVLLQPPEAVLLIELNAAVVVSAATLDERRYPRGVVRGVLRGAA